MDHGLYDTCSQICETVEDQTNLDCFEIPCPRYGARIRYTYMIPGNATIRHNYDQLTERQFSGEGFRSRAPPDCRIVAG